MKVSSILDKKGNACYRIAESESLLEASKIMCQHKIGSLMVFSGEQLKSLVTERDVMAAVSHNADLSKTTVASVMPSKIITCDSECTLEHAMTLMMSNDTGHRVRHLPVVDDGKFVGIISIVDVVEQLLSETQFENQLLKNYIRKWPEEAAG